MIKPPKCNALHCHNPATYIIAVQNVFGYGDYLTRVCGACLAQNKGIGGGERQVFRVTEWKSVPEKRSGYAIEIPRIIR